MEHFLKVFLESSPLFIQAAGLTLLITACSLILAFPLGLISCFFSLSQWKILRGLSSLYIFLVRGTPLIVQIFILYFGLTHIVKISAFFSAALALAVHNGGYLSEIFRGSINSLARGQFEAAMSLGMNSRLMYRRIILPQALKRSLPSIGNQFIIALKDSSLAAFISMNELFNVATTLGSGNFDQMTYLLVVSVYYLALVFILEKGVKLLEKRSHYVET